MKNSTKGTGAIPDNRLTKMTKSQDRARIGAKLAEANTFLSAACAKFQEAANIADGHAINLSRIMNEIEEIQESLRGMR